MDEWVKKAEKEEEKEQLRKKETKKTKSTEKVVPYEGGTFAKLKGKLTLPLKGKIRYKFGTKRKDTGVVWKGIFIEGKEGQDVKSVGHGKVAYADWLRGFGNLIIIDHGQGYMSLYGYNESVLLNVNDEVKEKKDLEKIILCDVQIEIYPDLEKSLLDLLHNSGYPGVKFEKKVDFEQLYNQRSN